MTQEAVARAALISTRMYQRYESGEFNPRAPTLIRLARVLHCKVEDIFDDTNTERREPA
ncbi:MAG: helix-turn-helix domain-containing protein [Zoogloeaceae bacterium]|jgi:transcriptional regulator with XRE-family HTH domain|nr:helix-turn-helix domain-containing protein [Zoogloeaceae bacterium]